MNYKQKIKTALKQKGKNFEVVNSCFELCRIIDIDTAIECSEMVKKTVVKNVKNGSEWYEL